MRVSTQKLETSGEDNLKWLTIYTDAGYANGVGTYGIWVRIFHGRRTFEGNLPKLHNNNEAEMYASVLGLEVGLAFWAEHYTVAPNGITISTDSQHTRSRLSKNKLPHRTASGKLLSQLEIDLHTKFYRLLPVGSKLNFKPVKGHSGTATTQKWLNNWCDKAAQRARKR